MRLLRSQNLYKSGAMHEFFSPLNNDLCALLMDQPMQSAFVLELAYVNAGEAGGLGYSLILYRPLNWDAARSHSTMRRPLNDLKDIIDGQIDLRRDGGRHR